MSMRKDREITIIRESTTKSSRPAGRLSVSLTEALLGDSLDPLLSLHEGSSINEKRAVLPGGNKENGKFIDRHPKFREFAANQSMNRGDSRSVSFDIDGIPDKSAYLSMNQNGIMRAYNGERGKKEAIEFRSDRKNKEEEPVLEITPDTQPTEQPNSRDADVDTQNADDAATRQAAEDERLRQLEDLPGESNEDKLKSLLPEFDKIPKDDNLTYEQKLDKWLETYNKAIDLSEYDDKENLKTSASGIIKNFKEYKENVFKTIKDADGYFNKNVRLIKDFSDRNSPMSVAAKSSLMDIMYKAASEAGGDGDPGPQDDDRPERDTDVDTTEYGDGDPGEDPQQGGESGGAGRPAGEPEGGDVIVGPPNGQGGGGQPQPPPTGDAKDVSDYIDQVAAGVETVDLSENRRPLHKRSLVELLYSR